MRLPLAFTLPALLLMSEFSSATRAQSPSAVPSLAGEASYHFIVVEVLMVAIPTRDAVPLIRELRSPTTIDAGYEKVLAALASGSAKLIGWPIITTLSGQRSVLETVKEFRYATEFDPGGVSITYDRENGRIARQEKTVMGAEFFPTPTAFETRSVGVTLSVEAILSPDEKTIDLSIEPQYVRLAKMERIFVEKTKTGEKVITEQPVFDRQNVNTRVTMHSGERRLLGVFSGGEFPDHVTVFILHAEAQAPK